ncbi:MAG: hypothetical protein CFE37_04280 [Alphaproteobacteria bacterium PA4]|nr:MAG: hypothetical protein CFE37_04280 [Alphaproteobacteria bacterium PA4]
MTQNRTLIIGLHGAVGSYLARLLQARGWQVSGTHGGDDRVCRRLGITDDIEIIDADTARERAATGAQNLIFACAEGAAPALALAEAVFAAAGQSRLCHVATLAELQLPAVGRLAAQIATWRQAGRADAVNALLGAHDSRLGPHDSLPARIIRTAYAAAQGEAPDVAPLQLVETGAVDWGWTPEYVDAVARIATAEQLADRVVVSGHLMTAAEIADHAFAYFRQPVAGRVHFAPAAQPQPPQAGSAAALKAAIGWSATTHGRDLVRAWCEGAADRL